MKRVTCSTMTVLGIQWFFLLYVKLDFPAMAAALVTRFEGFFVLDLVRRSKLPLVLLALGLPVMKRIRFLLLRGIMASSVWGHGRL